jgi:hypothetical protein
MTRPKQYGPKPKQTRARTPNNRTTTGFRISNELWAVLEPLLLEWEAGVERFDELRGIDWSWLSMDRAMTKAPLGGGKDGAKPH